MSTEYLLRALALAQKRKGFCAPNPAVGAVLVKNGKIVGEGYHYAAGCAHAEVVAGQQAGTAAQGATLYVTLEPCCHQGKTPPCTEWILQQEIAQVVYAYRDPNPLVAGQGERRLRAAGIPCEQVTIPMINDFYRSYTHWHKTGKPYVTAKLAISLDGKIAKAGYQRTQITGAALHQFTHQQRQMADAILTTINTILADDPQLNVRLTDKIQAKSLYVLDPNLALPLSAQIITSAAALTLFHAASADKERQALLESQKIRCIAIPSDVPGRLNWATILEYIGQDGVHDLWVEAGGHCFSSLATNGWINRALIYVAPCCLGYNAVQAFPVIEDIFAQFQQCTWQQVGRDVVAELFREE